MASRNKSTEGMARTSTRSVWKGAITFGLVHIPIGLYSATAESDLNFDWLDKRTGDPVGYKRVNKKTGREIDAAHIAKGIEYQKGEYVILSKEEIAEAYPRTTQTIEIEAFVDIDEVPFVYLEKPYYTAPINRGEKVYALLRETLVQSKKAGIARVVIQTKEHLAALVPAGPGLVLNLLRWGADIRSWEGLPLPDADARKLGHKRLAVNLSDLAAAGATPAWATLAIAMPSANEKWIAAFAKGLFALAERHGVDLVGGDTTRGPLAICLTCFGEVPAGLALYRGGARPGDDIWVSGALGGAALALEHPGLRLAARRLHEPEPRVELGERLRGVATSAIDVSDGFAQDLGHILERSGVGALVHYDRLPRDPAFARITDPRLIARCVLAGGDDYEIAFTAPQSRRDEVEALSREIDLPLARVGAIQKGDAKLQLLAANGRPMAVPRGFDHFAR